MLSENINISTRARYLQIRTSICFLLIYLKITMFAETKTKMDIHILYRLTTYLKQMFRKHFI